jgi:hypothetical protein
VKIEIGKPDVTPFLWLQNEVERVLIAETLRRAIEKGDLEKGTKFLYQESVDAEYGEITVTHTIVQPGAGVWRYDDVRHETYTFAEALRLCMNENNKENP